MEHLKESVLDMEKLKEAYDMGPQLHNEVACVVAEENCCLICREEYSDPHILSCGHMFCRSCWEKFESTFRYSNDKGDGQNAFGISPKTMVLSCPVCRRVVLASGGNEILNSNEYSSLKDPSSKLRPLSSLKNKDVKQGEVNSSKNSSENIGDTVANSVISYQSPTCDVCKYKKQNVLARDHCTSCGINYCINCSENHSDHCLFRSHSVVPVDRSASSLRCDVHTAESLKYYCCACQVPICAICAVVDHQHHDTKDLQTMQQLSKKTIHSRINLMSTQVMELEERLMELEDVQALQEASVKKTRVEIERHTSSLVTNIQNNKHKILKVLDLYNLQVSQLVSAEKESIAHSITNLKSLWKFSVKICEPNQAIQLVTMNDSIMQMIDAAQSEKLPNFPDRILEMSTFMPQYDMTVGSLKPTKIIISPKQCAVKASLSPPVTSLRPSNSLLKPKENINVKNQKATHTVSVPLFFNDPFKHVPSIKWLLGSKLLWKTEKVGSKVSEICEAYDVAYLAQDHVVVAEWMNHRLQIFDGEGMSVQILQAGGGIQPWGVTVSREGNIIFTDDRDRTVKTIDPTGQCCVAWKSKMFGWPRGVCENILGQILVTDTEHGRHQLSVHMPDGRCVQRIGGMQGTGPLQFHWPRYVCTDQNDRIIVSDGSNHCIKVLDSNGAFLFKFGSMGSCDGQFQHPRGVCTDCHNNIVVADQDNNRVTLFNSDGKFVRHLLALSKPWGLSLSDSGQLAVTQKQCLSVYKIYNVLSESE